MRCLSSTNIDSRRSSSVLALKHDTLQVARARYSALLQGSYKHVASPHRKLITGVDVHAGDRNRGQPHHERRLHPLARRMLGNARARIIASETHDRPAEILAPADDVDLVAAVGTILMVPEYPGLGMDDEAQRIAMPTKV